MTMTLDRPMTKQNNSRKIVHDKPRTKPAFGAMKPWSIAVWNLLADGRTYDEDDVIARIGPTIPPAIAIRHAVEQRTKQGRTVEGVTDLTLCIEGRRRMIQQTARGIERNHNAVRDQGNITLTSDAINDYQQWKRTL